MEQTTNYLVARTTTVTISATNGKWDRKKQEKFFRYNVGGFEFLKAVGKKDKATKENTGVLYDLVKDGKYNQIIPDVPTSFFSKRNPGIAGIT